MTLDLIMQSDSVLSHFAWSSGIVQILKIVSNIKKKLRDKIEPMNITVTFFYLKKGYDVFFLKYRKTPL